MSLSASLVPTVQLDSYLHSLLLSLVLGLGSPTSSHPFELGPDALLCCKDLKRLFRQTFANEDKSLFLQLAEWQFLEKQLIPILIYHHHVEGMVLAVLELLVPLTWEIDGQSEHPERQLYALRQYKKALDDKRIWKVLIKVMVDAVSVAENKAMIQMFLCLLRNLVNIPDDHLHLAYQHQDSLIMKWIQYKIMDFCLMLTSSLSDHNELPYALDDWNTVLLGLYYGILLGRPVNLEEDSNSQLWNQVTKKPASLATTRHSRFGGSIQIEQLGQTHVVSTVQAYQNPHYNLDSRKSNRFLHQHSSFTYNQQRHPDKTSHSHVLQFMTRFLESGFNPLVSSLLRDITRYGGVKFFPSDHIRFLFVLQWTCRYFNETQSTHFKMITCLLEKSCIQYLMENIFKFEEEKKWEELHVSMDCFHELLKLLERMSGESMDANTTFHTNAEESSSSLSYISNYIQHELFYNEMIIKSCLKLLLSYSNKQSREYFISLLECNRVLLRLLKQYGEQKSNVLVKNVKNKASQDLDESENKMETVVHRKFDLNSFMQLYANDHIIEHCLDVLCFHPKNVSLHKTILKLLHPFVVDPYKESLFFKVRYLLYYKEIMEHSLQDTVKMVEFIVKRMSVKLMEYPLLYVEMLFPKGSLDLQRLNEMTLMEQKDEFHFQVDTIPEYLEWKDQLAVTVAMCKESFDVRILSWLKDSLTTALKEYTLNRDLNQFNLDSQNIHQDLALSNKYFKLLLFLLGFEWQQRWLLTDFESLEERLLMYETCLLENEFKTVNGLPLKQQFRPWRRLVTRLKSEESEEELVNEEMNEERGSNENVLEEAIQFMKSRSISKSNERKQSRRQKKKKIKMTPSGAVFDRVNEKKNKKMKNKKNDQGVDEVEDEVDELESEEESEEESSLSSNESTVDSNDNSLIQEKENLPLPMDEDENEIEDDPSQRKVKRILDSDSD